VNRLARREPRVNRAALLIAAVVLSLATSVVAQRLATRRIGIGWQQGVPRVSVSVSDLVDSRARRALDSGLQKRLIMTVQAYEAGGSRPFATTTVTCAATFDLWEESYIVRIGRRTERHASIDAVLQRCLVAREPRGGPGRRLAPAPGPAGVLRGARRVQPHQRVTLHAAAASELLGRPHRPHRGQHRAP
jgi:hypothetical protein